jgi:hypothetical protein
MSPSNKRVSKVSDCLFLRTKASSNTFFDNQAYVFTNHYDACTFREILIFRFTRRKSVIEKKSNCHVFAIRRKILVGREQDVSRKCFRKAASEGSRQGASAAPARLPGGPGVRRMPAGALRLQLGARHDEGGGRHINVRQWSDV